MPGSTSLIDGARWLILSQYYPPEIGAPQIRLRALARQLQRHGIEVAVLTAMPNYPAGKLFPGYERRFRLRETLDGVPVRRTWVYAATGRSARARLLNYFSFTGSALLAALFGPRPDVIFLESQPLSLGFVGIIMKWLRRVPYIYNVPDLQIDVARQLGFMSSERFLQLAMRSENLFLRQSWKVSTVTHRFIDHFVERGIPRDQVTFLPNGADAEFLRPQPPAGYLLDRWQLHGKKVFAYVGTHAYYHGLDTLIHAAAALRQREDVAFLLVGSGPERERIRQLAEGLGLANVVFGQSPYEEMADLYSITYASVATLRDMEVARQMRLSKVFPALSCGVPVIYSGAGEAADLLVQHQCGIAVAPEEPAALAQAICELADDVSRRDVMGAAGRALIEREYSWAVIVERWLAELTGAREPAATTTTEDG